MEILLDLFSVAKEKSFVNYVFTILRVQGISNEQDPILTLTEYLNQLDATTNIFEKANICEAIIQISTPLNIILNLYNCTKEKDYEIDPFISLYKGQFPNIVKPSLEEKINFFINKITNSIYKEISDYIKYSYYRLDISKKPDRNLTDIKFKVEDRANKIKIFLNSFLSIYKEKRYNFKKLPIYYKLPHFMVLELILDDLIGIIGFKMHFSNGNNAKFLRYNDHTETVNISFNSTISFFVGKLDDLVDEWKIGNKRLFEIGLKGKYNNPCEWRPLVYPGKYDNLEKEARNFSTDPNIQSLYFYIISTGYRIIEFVVAMDIEFPDELSKLGNNIFFRKCKRENNVKDKNTTIYDCWVELDSIDKEYIESVVNTINIAINRIAFTYGISARWCLKYSHNLQSNPQAIPSRADLKLLNNILNKFPTEDEGFVLDVAIDWYNQGKQSKNYFIAFLCYYIALESVTLSISDKNVDFGLNYGNQPKNKRRIERNKCIQKYFEQLYEKNPTKFVQQSYFDCVVGLKNKTKKVLQKVFGYNHEYIAIIFDKKNKYSLYEIRSKLAHGEFTLLNKEEKKIVQESVFNMEKICNEFIKRLILGLKPKDNIPDWSQKYIASINFHDPRSIFIANNDKIFANKDWTIKEEWIS